jgi:arylsulfatase
MFCNRGIYHKGWSAVTRHSIPWMFGAILPPLDEDVWELYDTSVDWTQAHDVSAEHPDKLAELQRLFLIEAVKYNVLPLDDRRVERFNSELAGRPVLAKGPSQLLFGGMGRLSENSVLNLKNKSYSITADIEVPEGGATGVIVAQGGAFGGWSLYLNESVPTHCYNLLGLARVKVAGTEALKPGNHQVRIEFTYDGGGLGKGGDAALYVDGTQVGSARQDASVPMLFSADETLDLGSDTGTSVSDDYDPETSHFTGSVNWVQLDQGNDDQSHLITPEERMRVAMARQ